MKVSALAIFALVLATAFAKDLKSGNVLTTVVGSNKWGSWIPDLIFTVLVWLPMLWCNLMGFFGGLGGDELTAFQKCWAGWFVGIYGGSW